MKSLYQFLHKTVDVGGYFGAISVFYVFFAKGFPEHKPYALSDAIIYLVAYWLVGIWMGRGLMKIKKNKHIGTPLPLWRALMVSVGLLILPFFSFWGQCALLLLWAVFVSVFPIVKLIKIRRNEDPFADLSSEVTSCYQELLLGLLVLIWTLLSFIFY